jgi:hypothetical protein
LQAAVRGTRSSHTGNIVRSILTAGLVAVALAMAAPAQADPITDRERTALSARMLQTELMVAALACDANARYNAFVRKFEGELVGYGRALRGLFQRHFGNAGTTRLTTFVTTLANQASLRSARAGGHYCKGAAKLFDATLQVSTPDFPSYVTRQPFADAHGIETVLNVAVQRVATSVSAAGTDGPATGR